MRDFFRSRRSTTLAILAVSSLVSIGFWAIGAIINHSLGYWYLIWNLFLAWLPLGFVGWLLITLKTWPWLNWRPMLLTCLWLGFLPNSFYLVTDFIHLQDMVRSDVLYDAIMLESFVINGFLLGYLSLYLVHAELLKRIKSRGAAWLIGLTIGLCSFAIYLGRDLRWSSWDLLVNPAGILFSVSDLFANPRSHVQALGVSLSFFILLGTTYLVVWQLVRTLFYRLRSTSS